MHKPNVLLIGPFFSLSGYGAHSRDILEALWDSDLFHIQTVPTKWGTTSNTSQLPPRMLSILKHACDNMLPNGEHYIHIHIGLPTEFSNKGTINVGITAGLEADRFPDRWKPVVDTQDLVIVPSTFAQRRFEALGVQALVVAIGEGVDMSKFYPREEGEGDGLDLSYIKEDFCFLINGQWLQGNIGHDRKQIGLAIKLFNDTFANYKDVGLIVKTSQVNQSSPDGHYTEALIKSLFKDDKRKGNVYLLHGTLTDDELRGLYTHSKVKGFYSCTSGEGWYRPLIEAIACDLPVLVPAWSGYMDYLDVSCATIFEHTFQDVPAIHFRSGLFEPGMIWAKVQENLVKTKLLEFYSNYDAKKKLAEKSGLDLRLSEFTKSKTDKLLVNAIADLGKIMQNIKRPQIEDEVVDVKAY